MQEGNAYPLEPLMEKYGTLVLRQAFFYLKDRQRAEDACQEVFLRIYKKQPVLPDESSEKAYLLRVTINICKDVLKSAWNRKVTPITEGYETPALEVSPEDRVLDREEDDALYRCVLQLPDIYKDVIILFYYHDLPSAEIGHILGIPEVTVRTRLMRARNRLKEMLQA